MPNAAEPNIAAWTSKLSQVVGEPDGELYLIGHSIGVQTILRYLASIGVKIGGVLAVAGFFTLIPGSIGDGDDEAIAEPWLTSPIDAEKVKQNAGKIYAMFSDNDRFVALENETMFKERLGAKTIVLSGRGHIGGDDDAKQVPEILEAFEELTQ